MPPPALEAVGAFKDGGMSWSLQDSAVRKIPNQFSFVDSLTGQQLAYSIETVNSVLDISLLYLVSVMGCFSKADIEIFLHRHFSLCR